jgi:predicted outer membrane protein
MHILVGRIAALALGTIAIFAELAVCPPEGNPAHAGRLSTMICNGRLPRIDVIKVADSAQLTDGEIAYIYLQANLFEVETAELGMALGTSDDVKRHGEMVARDHRGVVKMFEELLHMNNIKPVETSGSAASIAQHQAVMTNLKARNGADFDKAYLTHEAGNHRAVIDAIRNTLLPAVKNPAIAGHMKDVLSAFEHHLSVTLEAAKKAGISETK